MLTAVEWRKIGARTWRWLNNISIAAFAAPWVWRLLLALAAGVVLLFGGWVSLNYTRAYALGLTGERADAEAWSEAIYKGLWLVACVVMSIGKARQKLRTRRGATPRQGESEQESPRLSPNP